MPNKFRRSRNGCQNCKTDKVKCDEGKPSCGRCMKKATPCNYTVQLRWSISNAKIQKRPKQRNSKSIKGPLIHEVASQDLVISKGINTATDIEQITPVSTVNDDMFQSFLSMFNTPGNYNISPFDLIPQNLVLPSASVLSNIHIGSLNLPLPLPRLLTESPYNMDLFEFYIKETSSLLTPTQESPFFKNPFKFLISQMAVQSDTLMNILLAFSANHKKQITNQIEELNDTGEVSNVITKGDSDIPPSIQNILSPLHTSRDPLNNKTLINDLLSKTITDLMGQLRSVSDRTSDTTLATVLMLTLFDIFFGDKRRSWREHLEGARNLFAERLKKSNIEGIDDLTIILPFDTQVSTNFLFWWFSYVDIVASLSSVSPFSSSKQTPLPSDSPNPMNSPIFNYRFPNFCKTQTDLDYLSEKRANLDDIERGIGVDPKILSLMGDISVLIYFHDDFDTSSPDQETLIRALELDHDLQEYVKISENERDQVMNKLKHNGPDLTSDKLEAYKILRATNIVFAFSGLLQLKRRILRIPLSSTIVKDILKKITNLIDRYIPVQSSTTSCIIFCLFCCGCDLIDPEMEQYRHIYLERIDQLTKKGVSSVLVAKSIMLECWRDKKNWWDILLEKDLDLTFAI
ncbi:similar to Lachancea thermotolerans KLTH0A07766g hypothetical protein [Maudiozyma saulgeensis]|uniref:Zn(2)-C6 fungal-type domain-containing protein n=1 Tax=Maudiozyma saulgeensis TaxID=1789683 RepID=A0A1X7RAS9_9SACH|nr:similar to Lachancea thermotolerans KLTH0A07766g hypothetical protein [Kazachstania saulgeensis]